MLRVLSNTTCSNYSTVSITISLMSRVMNSFNFILCSITSEKFRDILAPTTPHTIHRHIVDG